SVEEIAAFGGATPLYDAIVLAYAEELALLPHERNAMIILSDGLDNELYRQVSVTGADIVLGSPSRVAFDDLQRAVREMRALIYPVVLDPTRSILRGDKLQTAEGAARGAMAV